jgi:hypothetical protein
VGNNAALLSNVNFSITWQHVQSQAQAITAQPVTSNVKQNLEANHTPGNAPDLHMLSANTILRQMYWEIIQGIIRY